MEQRRHCDFGTKRQTEMKNRILLGDERGGIRKAYVVSNLDILFENELIDDFQREIGKTYWGWRAIARKRQGYTENPVYEETRDESDIAPDDTQTQDGAVWEMFTILQGLLPEHYLRTIDASCCDAHQDMPLLIIQTHTGNLEIFRHAFDYLDKAIQSSRRLFEKRCKEAQNKLDREKENA